MFDDQVPVIVQATVPGLAEVRAELEDALEREQQLREALQHQIEAHERELAAGRDLALREADAEHAVSRVASREAELQEREQRLAEQLEQVANDRRELNLHRTELVAEEARLAELGIHVDVKTSRSRVCRSRTRRACSRARPAARGSRGTRAGVATTSASSSTSGAPTRSPRRTSSRTRDEAAGARERDLRAAELEIERVQTRLQERAEAVAARETSTESRLGEARVRARRSRGVACGLGRASALAGRAGRS